MNFVAIDFETANSHRSSPCSLGISVVENGIITIEKEWLIQPPRNHYNERNILVHGITPEVTMFEPEFYELWDEIRPYIHNKLLIAYNGNNMDFLVLQKTLEHYDIYYDESNYKTSDLFAISKMVFSNIKDYKLPTIASLLGIEYDNLALHDALQDSILTAKIALKMYQHFDLTEDFRIDYDKKNQPKSLVDNNYNQTNRDILESLRERKISSDYKVQRTDLEDTSHFFYDKKVVITGVFDNFPMRDKMAKMLHSVGADVNSSISKKTNYVIVGKSAGPKKLEKIQELNITIISEVEFIELFKNE
ncbi:exonuclease domain-containing protein [Chishuiella sp.]|uniref:exonuclease domain-containing protein n=1 Tax=Chishuiella sp. TaxID=1969467 RepID=UPI0028A8252F|nr:exonuclease domain-containing protein [Chishuiella sp.]